MTNVRRSWRREIKRERRKEICCGVECDISLKGRKERGGKEDKEEQLEAKGRKIRVNKWDKMGRDGGEKSN